MYRTKYLFGIFSVMAAALYLLFAIVGFEDARTFWDRWTAWILCGVHLAGGGVLLMSSLRDKRKQDSHIAELISSLLLVHPTVSAELLAKEANMSVPDAHEYIEKLVKHHDGHVAH